MNCPNCKQILTDSNDPSIKICYNCKKKYRVKVSSGVTNTAGQKVANVDDDKFNLKKNAT